MHIVLNFPLLLYRLLRSYKSVFVLFVLWYRFVCPCSGSYTQMLPVSLDYPLRLSVQFSLTFIWTELLLHRYIYLPYAVFKSIVWCPWIHIVTTSKLFDISESLKLWCINNFHTQWIDLDGAMYRVIGYLHCTKNII
jgi:hypothetical protein